MEELKDINPKLSEVDIAYQILKKCSREQKFRELMQMVCILKNISPDDPQLMAAVHTQMNMDNRFQFLGQGNWGLREWVQSKVVRRNISLAAAGGRIPFHHRPSQDEIDGEEGEFLENYDNGSGDDEDEWEE